MLARENRLISADDFRTTIKSGRKQVSAHLVTYVRGEANQTIRFGFVVSKSVGNAVTRNLVKRRLRAIAREIISTTSVPNISIVVRAQETAANATFDQLKTEMFSSFEKGTRA